MSAGQRTVGGQLSTYPPATHLFIAQTETADPVSEDPDFAEGRDANRWSAEIAALQAVLGPSPRGVVEVAGLVATVGAFKVIDGFTIVTFAGATVALTASVTNYIYFDLLTLSLVASTSGFPAVIKNVPLATWPGSGTTVTDFRTALVAAGASAGVLPRSYLAGLRTKNEAADPDDGITVEVGEASDTTGTFKLTLALEITKKIDAAWTAGDGVGGFAPAGSVVADTWYHVHLIRKTSDGTIDVMFDSSLTAVNIPTGYFAYRRIGSVFTDSAANIRQFFQTGDEFIWKNVDRTSTTTTLGTTATAFTVRTPPGIVTRAHLRVYMSNAAPFVMVNVFPVEADSEPPGFAGATDPGVSFIGTPPSNVAAGEMDCQTNAVAAVNARSTAASTTLHLFTVGYRDARGRDA